MVYEDVGGPTEITAADLRRMYVELMSELGWAARPWVMISQRVRANLNERKTYAWVHPPRGAPKRVRVYRFRASSAITASPIETQRLASAA
jgi:hypothetical protein